MASIVSAAVHHQERRVSDNVRLHTGFLLTYEALAYQGMSDKAILSSVLEKRIHISHAMVQLPLSLTLFMFFVLAYYLHEDIGNVYFVESRIRDNTDEMFMDVHSNDDLWDQLEGPFLDMFFVQTDLYGQPLPKSFGDGDRWGMWGRVSNYNQLVGPVRLSATRSSQDAYGASPYHCSSNTTCRLCRSNVGFQPKGVPTRNNWPCGNWTWTGSRTASSNASAGGNVSAGANTSNCSTPGCRRRLEFYRDEMAGTMPEATKLAAERFEIFLHPGDGKAELRETLRYYRDRGWLDARTDFLELTVLLLNCELGRCRLEHVVLTFRFSESGDIYYKRLLVPIFFQMFDSVAGIVCDVGFFCLWSITTVFRLVLAWRAFLQSELINHLLNFVNLMELCVQAFSMLAIACVYLAWVIGQEMRDLIGPVRAPGWSLHSGHQAAIDELFERTQFNSDRLELMRSFANFLTLLMMFRFFFDFGAQPRLNVYTKTLFQVSDELLHFFLVFAPITLAFLGSAVVLLGSRFSTYATMKAAVGSMLRLMMESEYEWDLWAHEYFWYMTIWSWTLMVLVVLLLLNLVLAIILENYNDVRERTGAKDAETLWTTIYKMFIRCIYARFWVSDRKLMKLLDTLERPVVTRQDLMTSLPKIPEVQLDFLFAESEAEIRRQERRDLGNRVMLQTAGALMLNLGKSREFVFRSVMEDEDDAFNSWTSPTIARTEASSSTRENFLSVKMGSRGALRPHILDPVEEDGGQDEQAGSEYELTEQILGFPGLGQPPWLAEVQELLFSQRQWLQHANWQLSRIQWQLQLGHMSKYKDVLRQTRTL